jgi:hypothetical protein
MLTANPHVPQPNGHLVATFDPSFSSSRAEIIGSSLKLRGPREGQRNIEQRVNNRARKCPNGGREIPLASQCINVADDSHLAPSVPHGNGRLELRGMRAKYCSHMPVPFSALSPAQPMPSTCLPLEGFGLSRVQRNLCGQLARKLLGGRRLPRAWDLTSET